MFNGLFNAADVGARYTAGTREGDSADSRPARTRWRRQRKRRIRIGRWKARFLWPYRRHLRPRWPRERLLWLRRPRLGRRLSIDWIVDWILLLASPQSSSNQASGQSGKSWMRVLGGNGFKCTLSSGAEELCPAIRATCSLVGDVFGKGIVLHPSDGESHSLAQDKHLAAENIDEEERDLRAIVPLDNSMACWIKVLDCSRHARSPAQSIPPVNARQNSHSACVLVLALQAKPNATLPHSQRRVNGSV